MQHNYSLHPDDPSYLSAAFLVDDYGNQVFMALSDFRSNIAAITVNNCDAAEQARYFVYTQDIDL